MPATDDLMEKVGHFDAVEHFQRAMQLKPDYEQAHDNLRRVQADIRQISEPSDGAES